MNGLDDVSSSVIQRLDDVSSSGRCSGLDDRHPASSNAWEKVFVCNGLGLDDGSSRFHPNALVGLDGWLFL